jgi:hypothetical protein
VLEAQRPDAEARLLDALQNLTGMPGLHGVRLDDGECTFHWAMSVTAASP